MPYNDTPPTYWGKPVLLAYHPTVKRSRIIQAGFHGLVRRMETTGASQDELLIRIHELATEYGLVAHLVAVTDEAISFSLAHQ